MKADFPIMILMIMMCCTRHNTSDAGNEDLVKPYPHIINITEGFNNHTQLKLSEIADSIKYVVLSRDKQILIGSIRNVQLTNSNIYLRSDGLVMRFDVSGKFLNSFGSLGRGPEEYLPGSVYTITPKNENVIIHRSMMSSYLLFKPDGSYIGERDFSTPRTMYDFRSISDSIFLCTFFYAGTIMSEDFLTNSINWSAGLFDLDGNPLKVIEHPLKNATILKSELKRVISMAPSFTFFENRAVLFSEGDTIYEIDKNSITKGFIIDWGQIPHKQGIDELYFRQFESSNKVSIRTPVIETHRKAYFEVRKSNEYYIFDFDKTTGTTRSMKVAPKNSGFINDLDGGTSFYPYCTNWAGDIWIGREDANIFKEKQSEEFLSKSVALYPERKEKLREFINDLKMDDNPVLKIVYLKQYHRK